MNLFQNKSVAYVIIMTNFSFSFDKALDSVIDGLEHTVIDRARAAASDLLTEEYKAPASSAYSSSTPADLSKLQDVAGFWRLFDLQVRPWHKGAHLKVSQYLHALGASHPAIC